MPTRLRPHLNHATVVAYLALFVALGGGALAATSFIGSDGQIRACADKKGTIKVVKPGKKCKKGQTQIAWNQKGPPGAKGDTGSPDTSSFYTKDQSDSRFLPLGATAGNSNTLGGQPPSAFFQSNRVRKIEYFHDEQTTTDRTDVLTAGGMTLTATCTPAGGQGTLKLEVSGQDSANYSYVEGAATAVHSGFGGSGGPIFDFTATSGNVKFAVGTIILEKSDTIISVSFHTNVTFNSGGPSTFCQIYGTALEV